MAFTVKVKVPEFPADLRGPAAAATIQKNSIRCVAKMAIALKNAMVESSKVVKATGDLANSWQIDPSTPETIGNVVRQTVKSSSVVALVWDEGTVRKKPFPPTRTGDPLRRWVTLKLGKTGAKNRRISFAIARAISERGLPVAPKGRFSRAAKRQEARLQQIATQCRNELVRELRTG